MTREQSIALWLAQKMGKELGESMSGGDWRFKWTGERWCPQHDRAQCMEVLEWAAKNGVDCYQGPSSCEAAEAPDGCAYVILHNHTPHGIRACICEAIALATSWKESCDAMYDRLAAAILDAPQEPKP